MTNETISNTKEERPLDRFHRRWAELDDEYPTERKDDIAIFTAMGQLAGGANIETSLNTIPPEDVKTRELFIKLAEAYQG